MRQAGDDETDSDEIGTSMSTGDTATGRGPGARRPARAWEQTRGERLLEYFWVFLPFVLLLVPTVLMLTVSEDPLGSKLITLAIAIAAAAAYGILIFRFENCIYRLGPMSLYYAVALALLWLLLERSGWYAFYYFAMLYQAFMLPGAWAVAGVTASVLVAYGSGSGVVAGEEAGTDAAWSIAFSIGFTVLFGLLIRSSLEQGDRRRQALEEVSKAHERLEATLEENAALQRQLLTQAREAGVLDERARLAREIHDTLAQGLTGIITQLEAAEKTVEQTIGTDNEVRRRLDTARRLARDSLAEARRSVQALRPEPLEVARLPDALAEVASGWSRTSGVRAEFTVTGAAVPMHPEVEVTLLRTAQEALANVDRHARAGRVGITLSYTDDQVLLDVRDDGAGFHAAALPANGSRPDGGGFGLTAMRQRLARAAGTLEIESAPGQGTAVSASVPPVPAKDAATGDAPAADATAARHAAAEDGEVVRDTPAAGGLPTPGGGS